MKDTIIRQKDTVRFWTGSGWSSEYPDAVLYGSDYATTAAKRLAAKAGLVVEVWQNYGLANERVVATFGAATTAPPLRTDETYNEAKLEAAHLLRRWKAGERELVAHNFVAPACGQWFALMVMAILMDLFNDGERADFLAAIRREDGALRGGR